MSESGERFIKIFRTAVKEIPDKQVLINWMVYTLGVMSVRAKESELFLAEREIYRMKREVRH